MNAIALSVSLLSLVIWVYLLVFRGQFWRAEPHLEADPLPDFSTHSSTDLPSVGVVIPARNEADVVPITVRSLLRQDYPGALSILLVDDQSTDGTAEAVRRVVQTQEHSDETSGETFGETDVTPKREVDILQANPLPSGWTGKLWALEQGTQAVLGRSPQPDYILLSDADIEHDVHNLSRLVARAEAQSLDLASIMVRLRCQSFWETLLIPAFVFFFQKLYPFHWVNNPQKGTAAAAGGCILIRTSALQRIGGIASIRQALIDDCALAQIVKTPSTAREGNHELEPALRAGSNSLDCPNPSFNCYTSSTPSSPSPPSPLPHPIWLGLSSQTRSLRPYPDLQSIWDMVARTAYTQLNYSPLLLIGTLLGMVLVYGVAPIALIGGITLGSGLVALIGGVTWLLMAIAYRPIVRFYQCSPVFALALPVIALLYTLMTVDSALRHWQGRGGAWKGRTYSRQT